MAETFDSIIAALARGIGDTWWLHAFVWRKTDSAYRKSTTAVYPVQSISSDRVAAFSQRIKF